LQAAVFLQLTFCLVYFVHCCLCTYAKSSSSAGADAALWLFAGGLDVSVYL
jgi:hypothetical protein